MKNLKQKFKAKKNLKFFGTRPNTLNVLETYGNGCGLKCFLFRNKIFFYF